ncbi:MAG: N-acetylneuraminate synthase family protein [Halanaerobiales bacterium]|nr:N-acetylneuraminate synthase family protein [Halanaerobiales bacterium]
MLSTGMSNLNRSNESVDTILNTGNDKLILIHGVSNYPAEV